MNREQHFIDRRDAGRRLAVPLARALDDDLLVLALPRGGVPVGYEIARGLNAPLDVLLVRKLGAPGLPELGLGALVDGDPPQRILNPLVIDAVQPPPGYIDEEEQRQLAVIEQRRALYRHGHPAEPVAGRTVIVVDDGIATGGTVRAALQALARAGAARTVLAVPVAPPGVLDQLPLDPRDRFCLAQPLDFGSVGACYRDFAQTTDDEVIDLLARSRLDLVHAGAPIGAAPRLPL